MHRLNTETKLHFFLPSTPRRCKKSITSCSQYRALNTERKASLIEYHGLEVLPFIFLSRLNPLCLGSEVLPFIFLSHLNPLCIVDGVFISNSWCAEPDLHKVLIVETDRDTSVYYFQLHCIHGQERGEDTNLIRKHTITNACSQTITCNHPLGKGRGIGCVGQHCQYELFYMSGSSSEDSEQHTFLRFGDDAVINGPVHHTPILRYERPAYYLNLTDISIGKHRFKFPRGMFDIRSDFTLGFIIDTGSLYSRMQEDAFRMLGIYLTNYLQGDASIDYANEYLSTNCFNYDRE